ncbi:Crp/Fnr family transcriptional regulator [Devosia sp. CAU 1758]
MIQNLQYANKLLQSLPEADLRHLSPFLEPVSLDKDKQLALANQPIEHVYFPESGVGSIVAGTPEGHEAEAGLFGREGFGPISPALGIDRSPFDVFVQIPGEGYRLPITVFNEHMLANADIAQKLRAFAHVMNVQMTCTGLSNAVHQVDERLARWLLMCHDRGDGDEIVLTHEFLSLMLAVRRPSVTTALHTLEGNHFITAQRGHITMRNRDKLEEFAVDTYGKPESEYRRLLGPMR